MGANDWLSSLNYGTQASAGSAISPETTSTLGPNRINSRQAPDQYRIDGLQLARYNQLLLLLSQDHFGGAGLNIRPLSASPAGSTQNVLWALYAASGNQHPKWSTAGTAFQLLYQYWPRRLVTAATDTPTAVDSIVEVNRAGAVTVTLPTISTTNAGRNLLIVDISGAASSNNITVNRGGSDTINGATSYTVNTDYGCVWLHAGASSNWIVISGGAASGDITAVTAGAGLTGGGTSGAVTLDVGAGTGITVNANDVAVDTTVVATTSNSLTMTNKTLTAPVVNGCTSSGSTAIDFSGNTGTWKPPTGGLAATAKFSANVTYDIGEAATRARVVYSDGFYGSTLSAIFGLSSLGAYFYSDTTRNIFGVAGTGNYIEMSGTQFSPYSNATSGAIDIGSVTKYWKGVYSKWTANQVGAQLTAAATITPTSGIHHVTGATTIDTIATTNVPAGATVTLLADGGTITWSAGGNIKTLGTITQDKGQVFWYDGTSFYVQQ